MFWTRTIFMLGGRGMAGTKEIIDWNYVYEVYCVCEIFTAGKTYCRPIANRCKDSHNRSTYNLIRKCLPLLRLSEQHMSLKLQSVSENINKCISHKISQKTHLVSQIGNYRVYKKAIKFEKRSSGNAKLK